MLWAALASPPASSKKSAVLPPFFTIETLEMVAARPAKAPSEKPERDARGPRQQTHGVVAR